MIGEKSGNVQSVERAIALLEKLAEYAGGCSIKLLSEETGLHKSTVHRLLHTLIRFQYVRQDKNTDKYHLGIRLLYLGNSLMDNLDLRVVANPFLQELSDNTDEVAHLSIRDGGFAIYIDKVDNSNRYIRMNSRVGKSIPLYCSATGKVLLAWLGEEKIRKLVGDISFTPITKHTITDPQVFIDHLYTVRSQGYAYDWFENEDGIYCIASPIFDSSKKVVAAVSVSGTIIQLTPERYLNNCTQVHQTAKEVSHSLGCSDYPAPFHPHPMDTDFTV